MLRLTTMLIVLLSTIVVGAQSLERHRGTLRNGFTDDGEVSYTYRTDPSTREQIKQGTFRYIVRARDDQYRFNHSITGSYNNNLKDGNWSYKINQRDFMMQHEGRYTTGSISLEGEYAMGMPAGRWHFESELRSRAGKKTRDRWEWERYDSVETIVVTLQFSDGVLTGPFYARLDREWEVQGQFDSHGFFDGEWIWRFPDSTVTMQWDKGFEVRVRVTDRDDNTLHIEQHDQNLRVIRDYQQMVSAGGKGDYPFSLDTISNVSDRNYLLTALLHQTIFHPRYTLAREIGGNKIHFFDQHSFRMQLTVKGMNRIVVRNRISAAQIQSYSRIHTLVKRMEAQMADIYRLQREGRLGDKGLAVIRQMEVNLETARRYMCIGETMKLYLELEEGLKASERACAYHTVRIDALPAFQTKEAALQHLILKISDLEKQHNAIYQTVRRTPGR